MDLLTIEGSRSNRNSARNELYSGCVLDHYDTHMHTSYTYFNKAILYPNQGFIHDFTVC